jgi:signal peptidase I
MPFPPHLLAPMAVAKRRTPTPAQSKGSVAAARGRAKPRRVTKGALWENFKSLLGVLAIFFFVRTFLIEAYRIPSGSMIPTLLVGDWLFVNKLVYGPHIPFTRTSLPGYAEPKRFDVVVFESPPQIDQPEDPTPTLVKRLVGMPGDTIVMRNGVLSINGVPQQQSFVNNATGGDPNEASPLFDWQRSYALTQSRFGAAPAQPTHDNWGPLAIPPDHYFMMGDARYNSKDSRYWGLVPRANIRGRPLFVYYSWDPDSGKPLGPLTAIRWPRIGDWIR